MCSCNCDHTTQQQQTQDQILTDRTAAGRKRPWRKKRIATTEIADAYRALAADAADTYTKKRQEAQTASLAHHVLVGAGSSVDSSPDLKSAVDAYQTPEAAAAAALALHEEAAISASRANRYSKKAELCAHCGTSLLFAECPERHHKNLKAANFCRQRLCSMCMWRRSLRLAADVSAVFHAAASAHPEWRWAMLTLTIRNVESDDLRDAITRILKGWTRLSNRRELSEVAGWFRSLEVTRNETKGEWHGTWHPHIHAMLFLKPSYFSRGYISQARWRELWAEACGLDYLPVVEVHVIRKRRRADSLGHVAAEVAKYTIKDSDLIGKDKADTMERVRVMDEALRGRRLASWGGELRLIARQVLKPETEETEDLVHVAGENHGPDCPVCGSELLPRVYKWLTRMNQYVGDDWGWTWEEADRYMRKLIRRSRSYKWED